MHEPEIRADSFGLSRRCAAGILWLVKITLNFEAHSWPEDRLTVQAIMERKRWSFPLIIVTVNGKPVPRDSWATQEIADGDIVEMHHLISGG